MLSPADGRVLVAGPALADAAPAPGPDAWQQISIFLSPMDVHVNRMPASGRVTQRQLSRRDASCPRTGTRPAARNERSEIWIDHGGQTVVARQIVGMLARRVVCRARSATEVRAGDRFGIMKFGSRMDMFLPATATIRCRSGRWCAAEKR